MSSNNYWSRLLKVGGVVVLMGVVPHVPTADATSELRHPEGTLKLASRQLVPGTEIEIRGEQFAEGGELELLLVGVTGQIELGTVTTDSVGGFMQSFNVPAELGLGGYRLVAVASDGDEVASLNVEILAAAPETAGHSDGPADHEDGEPTADHLELDRAGNPLVTGGAIAAVILALGAGALMLRKR